MTHSTASQFISAAYQAIEADCDLAFGNDGAVNAFAGLRNWGVPNWETEPIKDSITHRGDCATVILEAVADEDGELFAAITVVTTEGEEVVWDQFGVTPNMAAAAFDRIVGERA